MDKLKDLSEYLEEQGYKNLAKIFKKEEDSYWDNNSTKLEDL